MSLMSSFSSGYTVLWIGYKSNPLSDNYFLHGGVREGGREGGPLHSEQNKDRIPVSLPLIALPTPSDIRAVHSVCSAVGFPRNKCTPKRTE